MTEQIINIAGIVSDSITDGPGLRMTIFAQGCPHNCKNCHNQHTHAFESENATKMTVSEIIKRIKNNPILDGVTFSGGEPFSQPNGFFALATAIRAELPELNIWCYSGFTYEQIIAEPNRAKLFSMLDILVDSPFIENKQSYDLHFRGSSNQRIINVKKSQEQNKLVLEQNYI
jgi:anaerobic ribonucleoside-triphosphate reductase activating protein